MIIPRVGDIWEFQIPGKRKKRKQIGAIIRTRVWGPNGTQPLRVYIQWARLPKGRYSGIRPKTLLKYGRRVSTQTERDKKLAARFALLQSQEGDRS